MIFTILGAVAGLERNLIVERVQAGLRQARAKGKRLGRPRKSVDAAQVASLRIAGGSWRAIARAMGVSVFASFAWGTWKRVETTPKASGCCSEGTPEIFAGVTGDLFGETEKQEPQSRRAWEFSRSCAQEKGPEKGGRCIEPNQSGGKRRGTCDA